MATDLIVWAWAVFVLRTVLSEVPEGLGPVSGSTGGYGPDSLNSTSGEAADSSSHEPKPHQSLSLHKPETLGNPDVQWILANPLSSRRVPFGSKYGHKVLGSSQEGRGDGNTAVPPSYSSALPSNPGGMVVHPSSSTKFPQGQSYQSSAFNVIQPTNSKLFQNKDAPSMGQDAPNPSEPGSQDAPNPSEPGRPDAPGAGPDASSMGRVLQRFPEQFISRKTVDVMQVLNEPNSKFFQNKDELDQELIQSSEMHEPDASTVYRWPVSNIQLQSQHSGAVQIERRPSKGADFQARPQTNDQVLQSFPEQFISQKTVDVIKVLNDPNSESLYGSKTSQEAECASNVLHQKEQGTQQPIQSTDTTVSHGVQMLEPSKTNPVQSPNEFYSEPDPQFGSEGTLRPGYHSAATATEILGTTSGYLSPHEPKYRLPAQTSSSYSYGTSGQLANKGDPVPSGSHGPIRSQGGVEGRQPSGEQNLPSRVDALNRLKQALHNVSRGHLFHSVMQRLIPASSPSWNMGEGWDFLGSAENSPSLTGDQSHFGDDGNDLSTSVSRGETSSSKSSISHAPENVGSGKSDGGVMSPSPLVNVYGSGSSSALSNAVSSHRGNDGSARKGTIIQQTTKEAPKGPLQMSAACLTRKVIPAQRRIPAKSFYRKMSAVKPAKHHWPLLTPKRFRKLRVLEGKCEGAAHKL